MAKQLHARAPSTSGQRLRRSGVWARPSAASGTRLPANGVNRRAGSLVACGEVAPVPAEWVILRDLDQDDAHSVRVCDPHLLQAPRLASRPPQNRHAGVHQAAVLGPECPGP
jgi:hypothetical protein